MAIALNLPPAAFGNRILATGIGQLDGGGGPVDLPPAPSPVAPPPPPPAPAPIAVTPVVSPGLLTAPPSLVAAPPIFRPPIQLPPIPLPPQPVPAPPKVTTSLALASINQLNNANPPQVRQALNALTSRQLTADGVMDFLVRRVKISEVLGQTADRWVATTQSDFADAFQLQLNQPDTFPIMDSIVSIAVLNDRDLETELRAEHAPSGTPTDFLQNRRIVWQWPPAGTVLAPPYIVLLAVDSQDTTAGADVVQSILGQLATFQGFKLPQLLIPKLG